MSSDRSRKLFTSRPNRFDSVPVITVNSLWSSWVAGCLMNVVFLLIVLAFIGGFWIFSLRGGVAAPVSVATVAPLPSQPASTNTPVPTITPPPTATLAPTNTPVPTITAFPTMTPFPTATPFTFTIQLPTVVPTSVPLYTFHDLDSGAASVDVVSEYAYGFYRALCVEPDEAFIQPRVVGVPEKTGVIWHLWNDYGYLDTLDHTKDVTFYLSDDASVWHLALFYYDVQVSDQVNIDYPGSCRSTQVIFVQAKPPLASNVTVSSVFSVTVSR